MSVLACLLGHSFAAGVTSKSQLAVDVAARGHLRKAPLPDANELNHIDTPPHTGSASPPPRAFEHTLSLSSAWFHHIPVLRLMRRSSTNSMTSKLEQHAQAGPPLGLAVMDFIVIGVIIAVSAFLYMKLGLRVEATEKGTLKPSTEEAKFNFGLFDFDNCCDRDMTLCLCSWCCLPVRWADSVSQEKVKIGVSFWAAVATAGTLFAIDTLTAGLSLLVFVAFAALARQKMREAMGLEHGTAVSMLCDFATWCFCSPCAAAQEAREVQYMPVRQGTA